MGLNLENQEKSSQKFGDILGNSAEVISLLKNSSDGFWGGVESILKEKFLINYPVDVSITRFNFYFFPEISFKNYFFF